MSNPAVRLLFPVALAALLAACATSDAPQVAVLVEVPRPPGADAVALRREFEHSLATDAPSAGSLRTYLIESESVVGAVSLWRRRDAAEAFFDAGWHARVRAALGAEAQLHWFEVPVTTEGAASGPSDLDAVVTVVRVPAPWYAPRALIVRRMRASVPTYQQTPGLRFKYFTLDANRDFGGIYLWVDRAAADDFHDDAWHARIQASYDDPGRVDLYSAPIVRDHSGAGGS